MGGDFCNRFALEMFGGGAAAQQPKRIPRIGYLGAGSAARSSATKIGGSARTWLHRRNEHRHRIPIYESQHRWVPKLAAELVSLKVDLIVAGGGNGLPAR